MCPSPSEGSGIRSLFPTCPGQSHPTATWSPGPGGPDLLPSISASHQVLTIYTKHSFSLSSMALQTHLFNFLALAFLNETPRGTLPSKEPSQLCYNLGLAPASVRLSSGPCRPQHPPHKAPDSVLGPSHPSTSSQTASDSALKTKGLGPSFEKLPLSGRQLPGLSRLLHPQDSGTAQAVLVSSTLRGLSVQWAPSVNAQETFTGVALLKCGECHHPIPVCPSTKLGIRRDREKA